MNCPLCNTEMETPTAEKDVQCTECKRTWYSTGVEEASIASRRMRVKLTKFPEVGDKITDILRP